MKRGTFEVLEMGYPMAYVPSLNYPPSQRYSLLKHLGWHFGKIEKFQKIQIFVTFLISLVLQIFVDLDNDFDTAGKPKQRAKIHPE